MTRCLSTIRHYVTPATVGTLLHFNELLQVLVTTQPTTPYPLEFVCGLSLPRPPPKHRNTETPKHRRSQLVEVAACELLSGGGGKDGNERPSSLYRPRPFVRHSLTAVAL